MERIRERTQSLHQTASWRAIDGGTQDDLLSCRIITEMLGFTKEATNPWLAGTENAGDLSLRFTGLIQSIGITHLTKQQ